MANIHLLPGFGSAYTSVAVGSISTIPQSLGTDDHIDLSHCRQVGIQVTSTAATPAGTIQVEQTFNGSTWANLGSTINIATDAVALLEESDGPFGKARLNCAGITAGSVTVTIVGFA